MRSVVSVVLCVAVLVVGGCSPKTYRLMPTPSVVSSGVVEPWAHTAPDRRGPTGSVFIASNRELGRSAADTPTPFRNSRTHQLHLAVSEVVIGRGMGWDTLVAASAGVKHRDRPVLEVVRTAVLGELPERGIGPDQAGAEDSPGAERWLELLNAQLTSGEGADLLVFVHGFNTDFRINTCMAAEHWHYHGRRGAVLSFAWPSRYRVFGYGADKANAEYAVRHMRELLAYLAAHTKAERIHILAHSAGCPIVVDAMRELRLLDSTLQPEELHDKYRLGRVVLAAPDMDLMRFFDAGLDGFDNLAERVAVYVSGEDDALRLSSRLFGEERLGDSAGRLTEWEQQQVMGLTHTEIVDVTGPEDVLGEFMGHSYYHRDPWVSSDVLLVLEHGLPAGERGLVRNPETGFWEFPDDYLDRLGRVLVSEAGEVEVSGE